ncbi:uncharacterized RNA-binding protein C17H9.04c-like isoform X2 [Cucurbita moschata]|uniref:Uncharacterized RNA-binding protein C17H9.04c-like isoform X2 n=1 Tax=Cucurbita moschata TaxID=3662 RepID=A0A6J1HC36_CUCMO|nr:uncharacterized RNA-binding protein C17H9.04c-like isoform X2 [Cucurbita moschata]
MSRPGDWNCRSCHHLNFQRRESCQRCGEPRADFSGGRVGSSSFGFTTGPDVRPGDWYCAVANCGAHNFASRSICFKCGASKDDASPAAAAAAAAYDGDFTRMRGFNFGAASNRPGWKSGDWICSSQKLMLQIKLQRA